MTDTQDSGSGCLELIVKGLLTLGGAGVGGGVGCYLASLPQQCDTIAKMSTPCTYDLPQLLATLAGAAVGLFLGGAVAYWMTFSTEETDNNTQYHPVTYRK